VNRVSTNNDLFDYCGAEDDAYQWQQLSACRMAGGALLDLQLTSQTWQGTRWHHRLHLFLPDLVAVPDWALLTIGSDYSASISGTHVDYELAGRLGIVSAHLYDVPNQPLFDGLREDELLAFSFTECLDTGDPTWPLLYPMVKAAVRAMDAVTEACRAEGRGDLDRFIVHGASKRGWATWLTAVVDPRVAAIAPEVYDNLNLFAQMPHQVAVWESYSEMIDDFTEQRLQERMRTPEGYRVVLSVDPYSYRDQLALPKLLLHSLNDRYWATDALNLYWDDLPGDKHVLYVPNQPHNIADRSSIRPAYAAFVQSVVGDQCLPQVEASYSDHERAIDVQVSCSEAALEARVWIATSPNQDFRAALWTPEPLTAAADRRSFTGVVDHPSGGYRAIVAECLLEGSEGPYVMSTRPHIVGPGV
jgi:PhoPQ-activated pathogenicity-related protein